MKKIIICVLVLDDNWKEITRVASNRLIITCIQFKLNSFKINSPWNFD